jgi:hypothetical protein
MVEISEAGDKVKKNWKSKVARATGGNNNLDRKVMRLKTSWDEVEGILNKAVKKKKK